VPEYSEEEAHYAQNIAASLLRDGADAARDLEPGFSIEDVESDAGQFNDDLDSLEEIGQEMPALKVAEGPPVPMSLSLFFPQGFWLTSHRLPRFLRYEFWRDLREVGSRYPEDRVTYLEPSQARENFQFRVVDFLANRLAAVRRERGKEPGDRRPTDCYLHLPQYRGGPSTSIPGCAFSVLTQSSGLSAYWSGAYYVKKNYHGAPTSPAIAPLQAGTYIFGVNGGAYGDDIRWDHNKICTLPGSPSVQLPF
jgi:hypothetical protein